MQVWTKEKNQEAGQKPILEKFAVYLVIADTMTKYQDRREFVNQQDDDTLLKRESDADSGRWFCSML